MSEGQAQSEAPSKFVDDRLLLFCWFAVFFSWFESVVLFTWFFGVEPVGSPMTAGTGERGKGTARQPNGQGEQRTESQDAKSSSIKAKSRSRAGEAEKWKGRKRGGKVERRRRSP